MCEYTSDIELFFSVSNYLCEVEGVWTLVIHRNGILVNQSHNDLVGCGVCGDGQGLVEYLGVQDVCHHSNVL